MVNKNIRITKLPHRGKNLNFFQTIPLQKTILAKKPPPTTPFPLHFLPNPQPPTTSHTRNFMLYTPASLGRIGLHSERPGLKPKQANAQMQPLAKARPSNTVTIASLDFIQRNTAQPQQTARFNTVYLNTVG